MEKEKSPFIEVLSWAAIAGNILFVLWVTYNGIKENFRGNVIEKISYICLMGLLVTNVFLLLRKKRK